MLKMGIQEAGQFLGKGGGMPDVAGICPQKKPHIFCRLGPKYGKAGIRRPFL